MNANSPKYEKADEALETKPKRRRSKTHNEILFDSKKSGNIKPSPLSESNNKKPSSLGRGFKILTISGLFAIGVIAILLIALFFWDKKIYSDHTPRNIELAGFSVSSTTESDLRALLIANKELLETAKIRLISGNAVKNTSLRELQLEIDVSATAESTTGILNDKPLYSQIFAWTKSLIKPQKAQLIVTPTGSFNKALQSVDPTGAVEPIEPRLDFTDGKYVPTSPKDGRGINPTKFKIELLKVLDTDGHIFKIVPERLKPKFGIKDAQNIADKANSFSGKPFTVNSSGDVKTIGAETYKNWLGIRVVNNKMVLGFDNDRTQAGLQKIFPEQTQPVVEARGSVVNGKVVFSQSRTGTACCGLSSADILARVVLDDNSEATVDLPLRTVQPKLSTAAANKLGIVEEISTYTTNHKPNQPRVKNIHRFADLVKGQVIKPGDTFSLNGFVGKRTSENGFLVDHVIENGKFTSAIGGGISQFATTTFAASFFGGLDIPEHQSHSIYISCYPYGLDATLSFPKPDLRITNSTPYGVLLWPVYTETSLTIKLFSTKYYETSLKSQTKGAHGNCTIVRSLRTRTKISDQTTKTDSFRAVYRPKEGVNC